MTPYPVQLFEYECSCHCNFPIHDSLFPLQTRDLFVFNMEPSNFVQYCCHWLLPALILHGDTSNLNWVAKVGDFSLYSVLNGIVDVSTSML